MEFSKEIEPGILKEINLEYSLEGILWPPDGNSQLTEKNPDAGKDWGQEEKGAGEDKMVKQHHWLNGYEVWANFER